MPPPLPKLGPVADAGGAALDVLTKVGEVFRDLAVAVKNVLLPLEGFGKTAKSVGEAIGTVGSAMKGLGAAALGAGNAFMEIGNQLAQFVRLASPAVFQQFVLVMEDLTAVIGQIFTPILIIVTAVIRHAADALQTLVPIGQAVATALRPLVKVFKVIFDMAAYQLTPVVRMVEQFAPVIANLGEALALVFQAIQPLFELFIDVLGTVVNAALKPLVDALTEAVPYITAFAMVLKDMVTWLAKAARELLALLGIELETGPHTKPGSSVGAAAKGANIGSVEGMLAKAMTSAFALGSAASTPEGRTASAAEALRKKAEELHAEFKNWFQHLFDRIDRFLKSPERTVREAGDAVRGFGERILDAHKDAGRAILEAPAEAAEKARRFFDLPRARIW